MARAAIRESQERKYWNPEIEGMDPGELRRLEGRKLADHKPFSLALSGLPKAQHVIGYLSVEALAGAFDRDMAEQIASASAELRQKSSGSKDWIRQRQAGLRSHSPRRQHMFSGPIWQSHTDDAIYTGGASIGVSVRVSP